MRNSTEVAHHGRPRSLRELAADVQLARQTVHACRAAPVVWESLHAAQRELLQAMEVYVMELTARHLPVPHLLRDDLRLQRQLYGGPRARHDPPRPPRA